MSKMWRKKLTHFFLLIIVISFQGLLYGSPEFSVSKAVKNKLTSLIQDRTGLSTDIGNIEFDILNKKVRLQDIRIGNKLIFIPRMDITVLYKPLFFGQLTIDKIEVFNPILNLSQKNRSQIRWSSPTSVSNSADLPRVFLIKAEINILDDSLSVGQGRYLIDGGLHQGANKFINFEINYPGSGKTVSGNFEGSVTVVGEVSPQNLLTSRIKALSLRGSRLTGEGSIELSSGKTSYALQLDTTFNELSQYLKIHPFKRFFLPTIVSNIKVNRDSRLSNWDIYARTILNSKENQKRRLDFKTNVDTNKKSQRIDLFDYEESNTKVYFRRNIPRNTFELKINDLPLDFLSESFGLKFFKGQNLNILNHTQFFWGMKSDSALIKGTIDDQTGRQGVIGFNLFPSGVNNINLRTSLNKISAEMKGDISFSGLSDIDTDLSFDLSGPLNDLFDSNVPVLSFLKKASGDTQLAARLKFQRNILAVAGQISVTNPTYLGLQSQLLESTFILNDRVLTFQTLNTRGEHQVQGGLIIDYRSTDLKPYFKGSFEIAQSNFKQTLGFFGVTNDQNAYWNGRINFEGKRGAINTSAQIYVDRYSLFNLSPVSFYSTVKFDGYKSQLSFTDIKAIPIDPLNMKGPERVFARGVLDFDLRNKRTKIDLQALLLTKPSPDEVVQPIKINVDLAITNYLSIGLPFIPKGTAEIQMGENSNNKLLQYNYDGKDLLIRSTLDAKADQLLILGNTVNNKTVGTVNIDFSTTNVFNTSLRLFSPQAFLPPIGLNASGSFLITSSSLNYSLALNKLTGLVDGFDLNKDRSSLLKGTEREIFMNLYFRSPSVGTDSQESFMNIEGIFPIIPDKTMKVTVQGSTRIADIQNTIALFTQFDPLKDNGIQIGGGTQSDITLSGLYSRPKVNGSIKVENGFLSLGNRSVLSKFKGTINLDQERVIIQPESQIEGEILKSPATLSGFISWEDKTNVNFDFNVGIDQFRFDDNLFYEGFSGQGSLILQWSGRPNQSVLKGLAKLRNLDYASDLGLSDLVVMQSALAASSLSNIPNQVVSGISMNIALVSDKAWNIRTDLGKFSVKPIGVLRLLGSVDRPSFQGQVAINPGGRITNLFPAGELLIENGRIIFSDQLTNPSIDFLGSISIPGYKLTLGIKGDPDNVAISATSTPYLKRDEVFALLINPDLANTFSSGSTSSQATFGSQGLINEGQSSIGLGLFSSLLLSDLQTRIRKSLGLERISVNIRTGTSGKIESDIQFGWSLFNDRIPLVFTQKQIGDLRVNSAKFQWNLKDRMFNIGFSQTVGLPATPSGEIRFNWNSRK